MSKYLVEEVRSHAAMLRDCRINTEATRDKQQDRLADICDAYADLLERIKADEGAVPFCYAYRYADGIKIRGAGRERNGMRPTEVIPLFTRPPAQAAKVAASRLGAPAWPGQMEGAPAPEGWEYRSGYIAPTAEPVGMDEDALSAIAMLDAMAAPDGGVITKKGAAQIAATIRRLAAQPRTLPGGMGEVVKVDSMERFKDGYRTLLTEGLRSIAGNEKGVVEVFVCSNPRCTAVYTSDPHGHCPACKQTDGSGWSTSRRDVL